MAPNAIIDTLNASVPFARHVGVDVLDLSPNGAEAELPERPELLNHVASQHAGALFTLAEAASGAAMIGALGDQMGKATPLVRTATIRYLKVAKGAITAKAALAEPASGVRARFQEHGRADFNIAVVLTDAQNVDVATFNAEWSLRSSLKS